MRMKRHAIATLIQNNGAVIRIMCCGYGADLHIIRSTTLDYNPVISFDFLFHFVFCYMFLILPNSAMRAASIIPS